MIFTKETCSQHDVENELLDAIPQEISVCLLVINTVKMFLPVKKNYNITAHQIYFCIFVNDVLEYAGYSKFTRQLCPSTSIANIDALHLDAPSLYQIMNQKLDGHQDQADVSTTGLIIYGYNNEPMPSIETARRNKDAVFNSVFDMNKIQETCKSYGLKFSQQIAILPGLKTVRILGVKKNTMPSTELKKLSYSERVLNNTNVIREGQKSLEDL